MNIVYFRHFQIDSSLFMKIYLFQAMMVRLQLSRHILICKIYLIVHVGYVSVLWLFFKDFAELLQAWRFVVCDWLLKWYSKYRGLVWYGIKYVQKIPFFNYMGMRSQMQKIKANINFSISDILLRRGKITGKIEEWSISGL